MDESEIYLRLGQSVHKHRERLKISQVELGRAIGLSRASIANIETGRQRIPLHHLYRLARALKVEPQTLLPTDSEERPVRATRNIKATLDLSESEQAQVARVIGEFNSASKRAQGDDS